MKLLNEIKSYLTDSNTPIEDRVFTAMIWVIGVPLMLGIFAHYWIALIQTW